MLASLLLLSPRTLNAQSSGKATVSGTVIEQSTGEPLVGVAVYIAGTAQNAYTDAEGKYRLTFKVKDGLKISFSLLGMHPVDVVYTGQKTIDVKMKNSEQLDDVIVTGYSKIRKQGFTGNTVTVTKEEILKVSPKNVLSSIQVFDPSFRMVENISAGSDPNALPEFHLRGQSGVNMELSTNTADISRQNLTGNNNLPIFILDGFEVSVEKIYDMDPNRISSLTLLKDAAATALYGSRAANGVVVIESRAPERGRLRVTYNATATLEAPDLSAYNLMNARENLMQKLQQATTSSAKTLPAVTLPGFQNTRNTSTSITTSPVVSIQTGFPKLYATLFIINTASTSTEVPKTFAGVPNSSTRTRMAL